MRKLASIKEILSIEPIEGKDRIVLARIDGWQAIIKKGEFNVGDRVIFCEPDSVLPKKPEFEFLAKYNYRIKTQKMGKGYSQGLVLPIGLLPKGKYELGDDVTGLLGITQYERTMDKEAPDAYKQKAMNYPKWLTKYSWFRRLFMTSKKKSEFPSFIKKTDEERIQNVPYLLNTTNEWVVTEKIDGTSGTFVVVRKKGLFRNKYEFIVCSRNMRLSANDDGSVYWDVAKKYKIKEELKQLLEYNPQMQWICVQGECIAPRIQGNKYKVVESQFFAFNLISSTIGRYGSLDAKTILKACNIPFVPIIEQKSLTGMSVNDVLEYATGNSVVNPNVLREGYVFRTLDGKMSFKAVSPKFLLKNDE